MDTVGIKIVTPHWIWCVGALLAAACSTPSDETPGDTATETELGDTATEIEWIQDLEVTVSDVVRTVATVEFKTKIPARCYIAFGPTEEMAFETRHEEEESVDHTFPLLGLASNTNCHFQVVAKAGEQQQKSDIQTVKTGGVSTQLPALKQSGDGYDGFVMVPLIGATTAVTIINKDGEFVWYHLEDRGLETFRVRLSMDGKGLVYNAATVSGDPSEESDLVRISFDGKTKESIPVPLLAHDFVEHPDGTLAAIVAEFREFEGEEIRGEQILEISPEGEERVIWRSWDCFDPAENQGDMMGNDWTFANALDYDPEAEVYYIGMRNISSIAKVPRTGGECEWVLGSTGETLAFADGTPPFLHQHQFQVLPESILVFDNEGAQGLISRVIEYSLDPEAGEATEIWRYQPGDLYSFVLGEPTRLENGDTFINWSAAGVMNRVTPDGEEIWKINTPMGHTFGFNTLSTSLYTP
jgi:hypothetical protein